MYISSSSYIKSNISFRLLSAAVDFSNKAILFEKDEKVKDEYYHYIFSCIILCASFLEANINELYSRIEDKNIRVKNDELLRKRDIPRRASILDKYKILLKKTEGVKLDSLGNSYQNVFALIKLRNAIVHYQPEWFIISGSIKKETSLKELLKGKYPLNPFVDEKTQPFFPYVCLSGGCSYWAVKNSLEFVLQYYNILNTEIPSKKKYDDIFNKISKISA